MDYYLLIRPEARADLLDAFHWYQKQKEGLGYDFKSCVDDVLSNILLSPTFYKLVHLQIRRVFLRKFPFGIFYTLDKNKIVILAVLHVRRDPLTWKTRSP